MKIQKSSEDYLETMLMLSEQKGYVKSIDIARHLDVTKPSVSYATKRLRENGYITMDDDGLIHLTESGLAIATKIYDRHKMLSRFLLLLGIDKDTADEDACKIEHDISQATYEAICNHVNNFLAECPAMNHDHEPTAQSLQLSAADYVSAFTTLAGGIFCFNIFYTADFTFVICHT